MDSLTMWLRIVTAVGLIGGMAADMSCKDMNGKDVDWWIITKTAKDHKVDPGVTPPKGNTGLRFIYADANDNEPKLQQKLLADEAAALGYTSIQGVNAVTKQDKNIFYTYYSDQTDIDQKEYDFFEKRSPKYAHAKGFAVFDQKQGFWILHSSPKFNNPKAGNFKYKYATVNGQTFFCGTYAADQLEEIGKLLFMDRVNVYDHNFPTWMQKYKRFQENVDDKVVDRGVCKKTYRSSFLKTKGGQVVRTFAKALEWGDNKAGHKDFWSNLVQPALGKSLYVQSWLNTPSAKKWASKCGTPFVQNIRKIKMAGLAWTYEEDHSKWAVSDTPAYVCVGDINREESQSRRGGGCVCIQNQKVWDFYRKSIVEFECCPGQKNCFAGGADAEVVPAGGPDGSGSAPPAKGKTT